MPYYDYMCERCGPFSDKRPMSESALPQPCPLCGTAGERAILTAPRMSTMSADRRSAFATNERSANQPSLSSAHGSGCGCCARPSKPAAAGGAKSFPASRPWMISH